ncbi:dehydrodolichyl diphosphate synthase complex subunit nus1 [Nasonia vitripennis]|uniref:ditrans,polycis-polyprenyl diphosphate synthase [(2E,6E)-farnesyldiphosphate specific] n=1 Tax=Nasonia vitripennis TaxID=7425 RepID=A0A7M7QZH4_NASVI|nr:dehydrodolichyl diphosphate synthase complex subunit nus1 [Nasonia vitripennis]XP_032457019.1 dehydrodolichyl diphosphate synthase complex subunit nus1 [Nasonia vitripennis]
MYIVLWFLFIVAHSLYDFFEFIKKQCKHLRLRIEQRGYLNKFSDDYSFLTSNNCLATASKIPRHLAILLGQEEISVLDLRRLISWCAIAEIPYITFYDHKGILQKSQDLIRSKIDELEPLAKQNVEWSHSFDSTTNNKIVAERQKNKRNSLATNAIQSDATELINIRKSKLQVLSYTDGKGKIIELTKFLAKNNHVNGFEKHDVTSELLDEKLNFGMGVPDPDLAIVFGKTMCTYGFLPWQTRVTEFFTIPSHRDISYKDFVDTIIRFSECQQRYGK